MLCLNGPVAAQGFAGLGTTADGYAVVRPEFRFEFPRDHGPHPEHRIEWWYLTATLTGDDGADYGIQWTLFRKAVAPGPDSDPDGWASNQVWLGHAAATSGETHVFSETFARGGIGQAGVEASPFRAWIDDWHIIGLDPFGDALSEIEIAANGAEFSYNLRASSPLPPVPQGVEGYSVKSSAGQASHYYSQPFYTVDGILNLEGREIGVTGHAWLDREWSSQPLAENQDGWDWFSLALDGGARVMTFRLRDRDGGVFHSGTWISPDGTPTPLGSDEIFLTPLSETQTAGRNVPVTWRIQIPGRDLDIETEPLNPQAWMGTSFPYWEGPIRIRGSHSGRGYLEMTGYE
jgi:predicted secreted hydrolase